MIAVRDLGPALVPALPAGWCTFIGRDQDGLWAIDPFGCAHEIFLIDETPVGMVRALTIAPDLLARLICIGFGQNPNQQGGWWTAASIIKAFDRLPAYRKLLVATPGAIESVRLDLATPLATAAFDAVNRADSTLARARIEQPHDALLLSAAASLSAAHDYLKEAINCLTGQREAA